MTPPTPSLAPLNPKALLEDLKKLLARVEADLLARSSDADVPEIGARLRGEYDRARASKRTAATYDEWRTDRITQAAVAWVLSCVFVRFLEDNDLVSPPRIAGPGERLAIARGSHEKFFTSRPRDTDREFLLSIFDELQNLPGTADIFGGHNALREIPAWLSGDAAKEILKFFQRIDASTGVLVHDFTDPAWDTRFLGDLYQDLSAFARERYALLQTPHFIEQFLLERTLDPALAEFGLTPTFKMIDPACGSGHLVLGSFQKILEAWQKQEPATAVRELVSRTLGSVHGIDINPFAVAIARFRLLLVAMRACGISKLADAPAFPIHIECGDSLLHTPLVGGVQELFDKGTKSDADEECEHAYASEDLFKVKALLRHGQYHAVMANPPYIVVRDPELNARYRKRFATCHRQYSLAVPFLEQIFKLAVPGGFTGQITANSFMKREFGSKLIEKFFPVTDLTHVIDTSGAYIPGHGTPTVILFGRRRAPVTGTVRAVMGIRGEPTTPADPAKGLVWTAITGQVDQPGSQSEFVSVSDTPRASFHSHPWSIGGGGASDLKVFLEAGSDGRLSTIVSSIGFYQDTHADEFFVQPSGFSSRLGVAFAFRNQIRGDEVRDWCTSSAEEILFPFDNTLALWKSLPSDGLWHWAYAIRTTLWARSTFGGTTYRESGRAWYDYHQFPKERTRTPLSIPFAFVATHNHFVLDRGGKVFNRSAPVIKLPADATEDDHLALLGILNSSTACFWMKQVFQPKATATGDISTDKGKPESNRYEFTGTGLEAFPLPQTSAASDVVKSVARTIDRLSTAKAATLPAAVIARWAEGVGSESLREALAKGSKQYTIHHRQMVALQEELDWATYKAYGLDSVGASQAIIEDVESQSLGVDPDDRPFMAAEATDALPLPKRWASIYEGRRERINESPNLRIIETLVYKRPWWGRQGVYGRLARDYEGWQAEALEAFLLERLERLFDHDGRMNDSGVATAEFRIGLVSIGDLATAARRDRLFMEAAEVLTGDVAFDAGVLIAKLVEEESCPLLPQLRYKPTGARKHAEWQGVWELQRKEDAIDARSALPTEHPQHLSPEQAAEKKRTDIGDIPVPPKYTSADFAKPGYWRLRGKLDVPKERFVALPGIAGPDGTPLYAWAGLNHLELAKAIGDFYGLVQTEYGGSDDPRLVPLLANLSELLPWVQQWHPETLPDYGGPPADFYNQFIRDEAAARGLTWADIRAWTPPAATRGKRAAKKAAKRASKKRLADDGQVDETEEESDA
ncbi:MAG: BREX-2 system adenine-specific DNA-methyltransferase PglX [Planctomycetia bacterium]